MLDGGTDRNSWWKWVKGILHCCLNSVVVAILVRV